MMRMLLFVVVAVGLAACDRQGGGGQTKPASSAAADPRGEPDAKYVVRGKVEMVPVAAQPQTEFVVQHEAIPTFKGFDGSVGMPSMSMPFPVGKGVDMSGVAVGDVVEIEFVVWSKPGQRGFEARRVSKLPKETVLDFGKMK